MDIYFEESVAGERGLREQLTYGACWAGIVLMVLIAIFSAVNIVGFDAERIAINWMDLIALVIAVGVAALLYFVKDKVYREYDYILWNSELEICAVYNRKRRKKVATIQLNQVIAWGPVAAMTKQMYNVKRQNWCVHEDKAWCLVCSGEDGKRAALLEFTDEMCAQLRMTDRSLRASEVKP